MSAMYGLFGKIIAQPGQGDALAALLLRAAEGMRDLDGCYLYIVSRDPGDVDAVWVTEAWRSADDHRASLSQPATQTLIAEGRALIAAMGERFEVIPQGGKGLPRA